MLPGQALEYFRQLTATYFAGATVKIGRQSRTAKPRLPLVSLTSGAIHRESHAIEHYVDGEIVTYYPSRLTITVDLFTHGSPVIDAETGQTVGYENSAMEDMLSFANFLNSQYTLDWCQRLDVAIQFDGDAQDLTGLVNDNNYEYRSRLQVLFYYTQVAIGYAGLLSGDNLIEPEDDETGNGYSYGQNDGELSPEPAFTQTSSGGGTAELAEESTGYFTEAEVEERREDIE